MQQESSTKAELSRCFEKAGLFAGTGLLCGVAGYWIRHAIGVRKAHFGLLVDVTCYSGTGFHGLCCGFGGYVGAQLPAR